MAIETVAVSGKGVALSVKSGLIGIALVLAVSLVAIVIGFKAVPLDKRDPMGDATRRLACGFLSSCTFGFYGAFKYIRHDPAWLDFWMQFFVGRDEQWFWALLSAGLPFIAGAALIGFWLVAGFVWAARRKIKSYSRG